MNREFTPGHFFINKSLIWKQRMPLRMGAGRRERREGGRTVEQRGRQNEEITRGPRMAQGGRGTGSTSGTRRSQDPRG